MSVILFYPYFGNIEFYNVLNNCNQAFMEVWDTYPKQTFRNRTQILGANGVLDLSIPVRKPNGSKSKTNEILIDYREDWQNKHLKSIESAYKNSPFYDFYESYIVDLIKQKQELLIDKNEAILNFFIQQLGISVNIERTSDFIRNNIYVDYRNRISPKVKSDFECKPYIQVFADRIEFQGNLSILDLLFNEGPNASTFLKHV